MSAPGACASGALHRPVSVEDLERRATITRLRVARAGRRPPGPIAHAPPDLGSRFALGAGMNLNSLVIAADASRARLFRTAQTNRGAEPVELIEIEVIEAEAPVPESSRCDGSVADRSHGGRDLASFATRVAERVARFAQYHFCNPVVVAATHEVSSALLVELEHRLSNVYIHRITGDFAGLQPRALMHELLRQEAFSSARARTPGIVEL